jgi:MoaD family protein
VAAVVKVRLFAALRELAGASRVEAEGRTAGEVVDVLAGLYGDRFAKIAAVGSLVVNGERATRSTVLADGDELAVLPPVSGGAAASIRPERLRARARPTRLGHTCGPCDSTGSS